MGVGTKAEFVVGIATGASLSLLASTQALRSIFGHSYLNPVSLNETSWAPLLKYLSVC
jgi:hypothetical protein